LKTALSLLSCLAGTTAVAMTALALGSPDRPVRQKTGAAHPALNLAGTSDKLDFDRDVRPILAESCFACHGFDANKRQAGLRLDEAEGATKKLPSGSVAILPGNLKASALVQRISATGPSQMPPAGSGKTITAAQIAILKRWVAQGAVYRKHWSFVPPVRPPVPVAKNSAWVRNPIDSFILARLEKEGLKPSPQADRRTIIRRVSLDLTGLPPTPAEVETFLKDKSPQAYDKVVDRLLASPHYGEQMALTWLDLARYADTHGYHIDPARDMWKWREWVIDAYNKNLPYDQFTIQQLAGDMLPNATLDQKIASGFNRNHPINFEGGAIPEEYAAAYIFDRIDTTSTTFMGLTMRCGQCHDHKYDPITQRDYYGMFAMFHNVPEQGLDGTKGNAVPFIKAPSAEEAAQLAAYSDKIKELDGKVKTRIADSASAVAAWEKTALASLGTGTLQDTLLAEFAFDEGSGADAKDSVGKLPAAKVQGKAEWGPGKVGSAIKLDGSNYCEAGKDIAFDRTDKFSFGAWVNISNGEGSAIVSRMDDANGIKGWDLSVFGNKLHVHLIGTWEKDAIRVNTKESLPMNKWIHVFATYDGSSKAHGVHLYMDGKPQDLDYTHDTLTSTIKADKPVVIGRRNHSAPFKGLIDDVRIYGRELTAAEVAQLAGLESIRAILVTAADKRTPQQKDELVRYYLDNNDPNYKKLAEEQAGWTKKRTELDNAIPTTMVMQEMDKPRDSFILLRGQYDKFGEKVTPSVPGFLPGPAQGTTVNRLTFAQWLVDSKHIHPLTSRVAVNRFWQHYFGTGIVKTAEDFGTQGERPTHPDLLDWLATEFVRTGWDIKAMQRLIVTSATYRQASRVTPDLLEKDPENRLLARGPRNRLKAEFIRDLALDVSGLLVDKIGGPSVLPYHPVGLWEELAFGGDFSAQKYVQDHGDKLYRRGMYTFWKRTVPPPALQTFDAPEREFCIVRRSVTNTPLQALILMNDPTYVEASRKLAERILREGGPTPRSRIAFAYELAMSREPSDGELRVLSELYQRERDTFSRDKDAATKLLAVGESKRDEKLDPVELAAWSTVASTILNMDETITKN
jgi:hypothetical protein